ncbi:unnamed protein product [Cladocopium goreaui]|uniref:Pentatricopeptide repeat-containing protein At5g02860 n=1 Tax=Cladocopium goreaui TaxID=2562237 RepID=A0A9P1G5A2_9DINO|nr:unnamed protein product [Cladocopium goreaui]
MARGAFAASWEDGPAFPVLDVRLKHAFRDLDDATILPRPLSRQCVNDWLGDGSGLQGLASRRRGHEIGILDLEVSKLALSAPFTNTVIAAYLQGLPRDQGQGYPPQGQAPQGYPPGQPGAYPGQGYPPQGPQQGAPPVTQELRGRKVLLSRRALLRSPRRPLSQESCPPLGLSSSYLASTSGAGNQPHKEAVEEMLLVILRTVTWKMKDRAPRKASRLATDNVLCVSAERQSAWRHCSFQGSVIDRRLIRNCKVLCPPYNRETGSLEYAIAVGSLGRRLLWLQAFALWKQMQSQSVQSDIIVWNSLASAANDAGRWPQAHALLNLAPAANLPLTAVSFTTLAQRQLWTFSLQLLEFAQDIGIQTGALCNAAISACAAQQLWQKALKILDVASQGLPGGADVIACSACITACQGAHEWQQALTVFDHLGPSKADAVAFSACIEACGRGQQWQIGLSLLQEMRFLLLQPNVVTWASLTAACSLGAWSQALAVLAASKTNQAFSAVATGAALAACEASRRWRVSMSLLQDLVFAALDPTVVIYNSVLSAVRRSGSMMIRRLQENMSLYRLVPTMATYDVVLAACEAESTRSSASQAVTRQDKKPRRAPSGVFTIVQKVCHFLPKDPKIFVAQKCADPCRHDGRNTKDSIHEVCCGRKMISFDAQLVQHTEVHPNERVVQAQNRALHHVFKNQTLGKPNYVIPIPTTALAFRFRSLIV